MAPPSAALRAGREPACVALRPLPPVRGRSAARVGIAHFAATEVEMKIVPPRVPWPRAAVLVSGVLELLGAVGVLWRPTRRAAGIGLFLLTIAVAPCHIYMLLRPDLFASISDVGAVVEAAGSGGSARVDRVVHEG